MLTIWPRLSDCILYSLARELSQLRVVLGANTLNSYIRQVWRPDLPECEPLREGAKYFQRVNFSRTVQLRSVLQELGPERLGDDSARRVRQEKDRFKNCWFARGGVH
jgi:hypothetical protein